MMGRQRRQFTLADVQVLAGAPVVPEDSFYGRMATYGDQLIREESFAALYSNRGRPSVSPVLLSKVLLLMFYENVSDRQAEERARYDLRWKAGLHLGIDETGFDSTALTRFRARLVLHKKERAFFEETVRAAQKYGLIDAKVAEVIDSTPVLGAGAVQDTYQLIRSAVRQMLKAVRKHPELQTRLQEVLKREDYAERGKPAVNWNDPEARNALLNEIVQDARTLLSETEGMDLEATAKAARELLSTVTEQDVDERSDGSVAIKQGVAKDRVISTTDPDMRHGRKSSKGRFDGYKAHVMENVESEIITGIGATSGNAPDAEPVPEMLDQQEEAGITVTHVMGDTAYGSGDTRAKLAGRGVGLTAPVSPEVNRDLFPKAAFEIDLQQGTCKCPAGHVVTLKHEREPGQEGLFAFGPLCTDCPLRDLCTKSKSGRTVTVHKHEELLQQGRAEQQTDAFKEEYRKRPIVERKIAELVGHGMRQARYVGKDKVLLQVAWTAAMVNLKRLLKHVAGVTAPKNRPGAIAVA